MCKLSENAIELKRNIRAFEAFSGTGTTGLALIGAGKASGVKIEHVGYSEIEPCAIKGHDALFGNDIINYGDVTKINWRNVYVDFLSWTFPCQSLSSARANQGNNQSESENIGFRESSGTKSALAWELKRALKEMPHKPRTIFVENVGNILSPKHRATFDAFVEYLQSEGYYVSYKRIDASKVGWPQHRVRVYLLATLDFDLKFDWPKERPLDIHLRDILEKDVDPKHYITPTLRPNNHMLDIAATNDGRRKVRLHNPSYCDKAFCLTTQIGRNDDNWVLLDDINTMPHVTITRPNLAKLGYTLQELKEVGYRKLTPTEYMSLMGLTKEEQAKLLNAGLSDTSIYFLMGNAIIVPTLQEIFQNYFEALIKNNLL